MKGMFISFEGIEGSGKTIQSKLLYNYLKKEGFDVLLTEEPGGTKIGCKIRDILLSVENIEITPLVELLLFSASRAQHIKEVIIPAIKKGRVVITDRFVDSTIAYQGYGRGLDLNLIFDIEKIVTDGLKPEITILLDLDEETGLRRNMGIDKKDRLELEDIDFHKRVRRGYLSLATKEPKRIKLIDASDDIKKVHKKIVDSIMDFIRKKSRYGVKRHYRTGKSG